MKRGSALWGILLIVAKRGYAVLDETLVESVVSADFKSTDDKINTLTETDLEHMENCSSFKKEGSCDPFRARGACNYCKTRHFMSFNPFKRKGASIHLGAQKCPPDTSFPEALRTHFVWRMAPQKFKDTRVCIVDERTPDVHAHIAETEHAGAALRKAAPGLGASSSADAALQTNERGASAISAEKTDAASNSLGVDKRVLIFAASAAAFVVVVGVVICISQR